MAVTSYFAYAMNSGKQHLVRSLGKNTDGSEVEPNLQRGPEFTLELSQARRFASQAAITSWLAAFTPPPTLPILGGTGTVAETVIEG